MADVRKNMTSTFASGLVMDLSPTTVQNTYLTSALNATLLTGNGNEMSLQQDMGNGRVETAYLPEGYVPVGTCEFGDIIYVVSYNPLEDKSQIGCFPSPERNISSEEVIDMQQAITALDLQCFGSNGEPTGKIVSMNAKKIVYGNSYMNPGDKYIIYEQNTGGNGNLENNKKMLSDYGSAAHKHESWPKLVKVSVVSIEDSGKIVDLNASVKWYDNDYYLAYLEVNGETKKPDLDSYRSLVSSAYSIFRSKVSGKLALLVELESIDGLSCAWEIYTRRIERYKEKEKEEKGKEGEEEEVEVAQDSSPDGVKMEYDIYFYTSWETSHYDVNPVGFMFTYSGWTTNSGGGKAYKAEQDPVKDQDGNIVGWGEIRTVENENAEDIPLEGGATDEGFDYLQTYKYTRTYELENPPADYADYSGTKSYYAQIDSILDWMRIWKEEEEGGENKGEYKYEALADVSVQTRETVGDVRKITRLIDQESGQPYAKYDNDDDAADDMCKGERHYSYYYNLTNIDEADGATVYSTKNVIGDKVELAPVSLNDDVVVNTFKGDVPTLVRRNYSLVVSDYMKEAVIETDNAGNETEVWNDVEYRRDLGNLVWNWTVAPVMPYGVLEHMSESGSIDFSKIGSGSISLTEWRYYNSGDTCMLTWGLEAYTEPNKGISEVCMDFNDNQGIALSWHVSGKTSYSGSFTESIVMGQRYSSYKMNSTDAYGVKYIHAGAEDAQGTVWINSGNKAVDEKPDGEYGTGWKGPFDDDSGTMQPNTLYLVRITVKYCAKNMLGEYDKSNISEYRTFWRWLWTNGLFNDEYYSVRDFDALRPRLDLDTSVTFDTRGSDRTNTLMINRTYYRPDLDNALYTDMNEAEEGDKLYKTLGACVYHVNQDGGDDEKGNVLVTCDPYLSEAFGTFNLDRNMLGLLDVAVTMGRSSITKNVGEPSVVRTDSDKAGKYEDCVQPVCSSVEELCSHYTIPDDGYAEEHPGINGIEGWDYSGYAGHGYGVSNTQVSGKFLKLIGVGGGTRTGYYSEVDPAEENVREAQDIWDESDSYGQFRDSFSLNICDGRGGNMVTGTEFSYYDQNGDEQTIDHYQRYETTMDEMRGSGMRLALAGTAFSKIIATGLTRDTEAKTLRSVMRNASEDSTYDSPQMLGMYAASRGDGESYDLMFDNALTWARACRRSSADHYFFGSGITAMGNRTGTEYQADPVDGKPNKVDNWGEEYNSEYTKRKWKEWLGEMRPFNTLVIACNPGDTLKATRIYSDKNFYSVVSKMGFYPDKKNTTYIHDNMDLVPHWNPNAEGDEAWDEPDYTQGVSNDKVNVHCLVVYDETLNEYVPVDDWFVARGTYKRVVFKDIGVSNSEDKVTDTLGNMVGSLFSQLYVMDESAVSDYVILDGLAYPESYTEYWNKDIVLEVSFNSEKPKADDPETCYSAMDLLGIGSQNMGRYIGCLMENTGVSFDDGLISRNNIDVQLYGLKRDVVFQYAVSYDLVDLRYVYDEMMTTRNRLFSSVLENKDDERTVVAFTSSVTPNTLYCQTSGGVAQFGRGASMSYAKYFLKRDDEYFMLRGDSAMSQNSFSALSEIIQYDNGRIKVRDVSKLTNYSSKYYIAWRGNNGGDEMKLSDLPQCSIFNKYNV